MAGLDLHRLIIGHTVTSGRDQDHVRVLHASFSDMIPDRTDSILNGTPEAPAGGMADVILAAEAACDALGERRVAAVPCNTFHAPVIWDRFLSILRERGSEITVLHMIDITVRQLIDHHPGIRCVGILSTTGTRRERIYEGPLERAGLKVVTCRDQEMVHQAIYHHVWGIKATAAVSEKARDVFIGKLEELRALGAEAVILGCTEIPLAVPESAYRGIPLLNPVELLAVSLIEYVAPGKSR